jgi:hypothetical protein
MGGEPLQAEELERITGPAGSPSAGYLIDSTTSADGAYELGLIIYQEGPQTGSPVICFSEYAITDGVNVSGGAQCAPSQEKAEEVAAFGLGASGACGPHPKEEPVVDGNWLTLAVWGIPETTPSLTVGLGDGTSVEVSTRNGVGLHIWEGKVDITSITFEGITPAQEGLISSWTATRATATANDSQDTRNHQARIRADTGRSAKWGGLRNGRYRRGTGCYVLVVPSVRCDRFDGWLPVR